MSNMDDESSRLSYLECKKCKRRLSSTPSDEPCPIDGPWHVLVLPWMPERPRNARNSTKWELLEDKAARLEKELEEVKNTLWAYRRMAFKGGEGQCSTCGAPLPTEAAFAQHYLVTDDKYMNLGYCPTRDDGPDRRK